MDAQNTLQKAIGLFRQGLHYQALDQISRLLNTCPNEGKIWELKGLVEDSLSWRNTSIRSLETATTLIPISASGQYILAKNYLEIGKHALAKSVFSILLQRQDLPDRLLPAISSYLGQYPELTYLALDACRKAVKRDPGCAESWLGMACFMGKLHYPKEQIANVLRKAVTLDPENRHYRIALSNVLEQSGKFDQAYRVVKEIKTSELNQIPCAACLKKLIRIFSLAEDNTRHEICSNKLKQLQSTEIPTSPEFLPPRFSDPLNN
ncbi:tetratricopeptide repeat protein [Gimesia fumaroli]|uniref:Uncharacterized protein n=1 Tax=Gimesia fumaroli TaxID=2527976 RepID=A0A518ICA9_9PLAN|nr:hypothetical protein [Gimesia fumaroli]QDV50669.1 hypothetical protein Enr17x_27110 [Gimesia fumaroli]